MVTHCKSLQISIINSRTAPMIINYTALRRTADSIAVLTRPIRNHLRLLFSAVVPTGDLNVWIKIP